MKRSVQFIGIIGLVLLVFGLLTTALLLDDAGIFSLLHVGLGALALLIFLVGGGLQIIGGAAMRRAAGYGLGVTLYSALFIGILVVANLYVHRHDPLHYDSTEQQVFTLAPQTQKVLTQLNSPVHMRGFFVGGAVDPDVKDLFDRLARASEHFTWEIIDPEKDPRATERYGISERDTLHFSFADESSTREVKVVRDLSEQSVVNAILKLTRGGAKKLYWISGHGEGDLDDATEAGFLFLKESIEGENIEVEKLLLGGGKTVPEDASAVLMLSPRRPLLEKEKQVLDAYLKSGGNMLLLNEPNTTTAIAELVAPLGIEVGADIVLDQVVQLFSGPKIGVQPVISRYGIHESMEGFTQNVILSTASSVRAKLPAGAVQPGTVTELAFSGESSWAETNVSDIFAENPTVELPDENQRGAVPVAVAYEGPGGEEPDGGEAPAQDNPAQDNAAEDTSPSKDVSAARDAREEGATPSAETAEGDTDEQQSSGKEATPAYGGKVVVIGDSDFVANVNLRQLFNRDFFLNALNWIIGEQERISIRERSLRTSTETLSPKQFQQIFLVCGILLPELVLMWGLSVWWMRKG